MPDRAHVPDAKPRTTAKPATAETELQNEQAAHESTETRLLSLQRTMGNQAVSRLLDRPGSRVIIRRHPAGAPLVPDGKDVDAAIQNPSAANLEDGLPDTPPAGGAPPTGGGSTPAPPTPAQPPVAGPQTPAPQTPAPQTPAPPTPTPQTPAPQPPAPTPAAATPVKGRTLQLPYSEKVLKDSFGSVAKATIIRGDITVANGEDEILAAYDKVNKGRLNTLTGQAWKDGDAKKNFKDRGLRLNGFADAGKVWVDMETTDPTTTVHEMLHINTASDFRGTCGEIVNEGMTERLAVKAMVAAGDAVTGSENTYKKEREFVDKLLEIVPEATAIDAYFNGAAKLTAAYETKGGAGSWATLKAELVKNDYAKALAIVAKVKNPPPAPVTPPTGSATPTPPPTPAPTT